MPDREPLWRQVAPRLIATLIRGVGATMRIRTVNREGIETRWRRSEASIIAFWHGRQLMLPLTYRGPGVEILISQHRDGELISRAMGSFGFSSVRGSTTRGGSFALRALVEAGRRGRDLAITPDGPKGPRGIVQGGVIQLARLTGLPIFPLAFGASKKKLSRPGTLFCFPTPFRTACSGGATRSGCRGTSTPEGLRNGGLHWSGR
jgi:lysophospholipid acyltransferase (LPLAT)-like uncharacterized protein